MKNKIRDVNVLAKWDTFYLILPKFVFFQAKWLIVAQWVPKNIKDIIEFDFVISTKYHALQVMGKSIRFLGIYEYKISL